MPFTILLAATLFAGIQFSFAFTPVRAAVTSASAAKRSEAQ